jgi:hypothetical protein
MSFIGYLTLKSIDYLTLEQEVLTLPIYPVKVAYTKAAPSVGWGTRRLGGFTYPTAEHGQPIKDPTIWTGSAVPRRTKRAARTYSTGSTQRWSGAVERSNAHVGFRCRVEPGHRCRSRVAAGC